MLSSRTLSSRSLRRAFPAALALCVVMLCGSNLEASCGDWLEGHVPLDAANSLSAAPAGGPLAGALPFHLPGKRPCNGPSCGRAPHQPLAPSEAPATTLDLERDAILVLTHDDASIARRLAWAIGDLAPLSAFSGRLDRPPRGA